MEHHHYIVSGFMSEQPDGKLADYASIDVFAKYEKEAISKAKKLVDKKFYRVSSVVTHDDEICQRLGN